MSLPLSRDVTCAPGTPVRSNTLNNIQDCLIGGKHGTLEIPIPALVFQKQTGAAALQALGSWLGVGTFIAPLVVPAWRAGLTVESVTYHYARNSAGSILLKYLTRTLAVGGATGGGLLATIVAGGAGYTSTTYTRAAITALGVVDPVQPSTAHYLQVENTNAANDFLGAVVTMVGY